MSQLCVYIELDAYLAQWFVHSMGGGEPVQLDRASAESKILETFLIPLPKNVLPDVEAKGKIAIAIPTFRNRPADTYNYLPKRSRALLVNTIRNRFDIELFNELHNFNSFVTVRQDELIYSFMEKHDIELNETNWNAIAKRYQRQRRIYNDRQRKKKEYHAKKIL